MITKSSVMRELGMLLLQHSYKKGTFTLTSGRESDFYIDVKKTALLSAGAWLIGEYFYRMIEANAISIYAVAGVTLGADPLVTATSMASAGKLDQAISGLSGMIIRKEPKGHGTGNQIESAAQIPDGAPIALLEDVITTGGTVLRVGVKALEDAGFTVGMILSVIDRQEGGAEAIQEAGYYFDSIFTRESLLSLEKELSIL